MYLVGLGATLSILKEEALFYFLGKVSAHVLQEKRVSTPDNEDYQYLMLSYNPQTRLYSYDWKLTYNATSVLSL